MQKHIGRVQNPLSEAKYIKNLLHVLECINTPIALGISIRVQNGLPLDIDVKPKDYLTPDSYLKDAQALAVFSKNPCYKVSTIDTKAVALSNFLAAETKCGITNDFFRKSLLEPRIGSDWQVLYTARHFVSEILKELIYSDPNFGPGSSISLKGFHTNLICKLKQLPEVTPHAHDFVLKRILTDLPHYAISCGIVERTKTSVHLAQRYLPIVQSNVFSTVPKNWKTDRPICIEPLGNMLIQKSLGSSIRLRLKQYGLDLNKISQDDIHGKFACIGSKNGSIATVDLASASDTVSYEIVKFLLPSDWFDALNALRCRSTILPDESVITNEKFSSMGNGFTFELETLIFYAVALATRKVFGQPSNIISVFGDDIVVSTPIAADLCRILQVFGFILNTEKTFLAGSFRESCGKDYFNGVLVRPIYYKDAFDGRTQLETLYYVANRIFETALRSFVDHCFDPCFNGPWKNILSRIPKNLRFFGPVSLGDSCLRAKFRNQMNYRYLIRKEKKWKISGTSDQVLCIALAGIKSSGSGYRGAPYVLKVRNFHS